MLLNRKYWHKQLSFSHFSYMCLCQLYRPNDTLSRRHFLSSQFNSWQFTRRGTIQKKKKEKRQLKLVKKVAIKGVGFCCNVIRHFFFLLERLFLVRLNGGIMAS